MRISDWSSDVCSSDLEILQLVAAGDQIGRNVDHALVDREVHAGQGVPDLPQRPILFERQALQVEIVDQHIQARVPPRSEEHTSELQSLMRISYAVFCLKKKNKTKQIE